MINNIKIILKKISYRLGYKITKIPPPDVLNQDFDRMTAGLYRFLNLSSKVNTIVDVGAAAGTWTEKALKVFPESEFLLVEPLIERKKELELIAKKKQNIKLLFKALGKEKDSLSFSVSPDLDGSGFYETGVQRNIPVIDLDSALQDSGLIGPFILKLDTHGFEVPILQGAAKTLKHTRLIVVEVYGFNITSKSLLFWEMTQYLEQLGFRLFDIVDIMRRPHDKAFWQCDAFFIPKDHMVFASNDYSI